MRKSSFKVTSWFFWPIGNSKKYSIEYAHVFSFYKFISFTKLTGTIQEKLGTRNEERVKRFDLLLIS